MGKERGLEQRNGVHVSSLAPDLSSPPVPLPKEERSEQTGVSLVASSGHLSSADTAASKAASSGLRAS